MAKVEVKNHLGRAFGIPFIVKGAQESVKMITLQKGLNYVEREVWDNIKDHPSVLIMLGTPHKSCIIRRKLMSANEGDKNYANTMHSYNEDGKEHKVLEVKDLSELTSPKKAEKADK